MSRLLSSSFLAACLALSAGCATQYQRKGTYWFPILPTNLSGGYTDRDLGGGVHEIHVEVVNAWKELALEYFDRRKEEIAKEKGYAQCETLYAVGINNAIGIFGPGHGAQADGKIKCSHR